VLEGLHEGHNYVEWKTRWGEKPRDLREHEENKFG